VSGPGNVTFTSPTAAVTNASFSATGSYTLRLTASDSQLSSNDDVSVTVNPQNQAPNVNAGAEQSVTLPSAATLQGTVTDDGLPTGSSVTVMWSKLSGPGTVSFSSATSVNTNASFTVAGDYTLQLTASDTALSNHDEVIIHVAPQNHAPTVNAGVNQTITLPASASLNGSVSDDGLPTGSTITTTWSKVSGPGTVTFGNANVTVTTATFSEAGSYVLRLSASDSDLSNQADVTITVIAENHAPIVDAGPDQTITLPAGANLNGTASDDGLPAGNSLTASWNKVSGPGTVAFGNPNTTATTATFTEAGIYTLRLTASDSDLSASDDVVFTVITGNQPPVVNAGADQSVTASPRQVLFFDDFESGAGKWMDPGFMVIANVSAYPGSHSQTFGRVWGAGDARSIFIPVTPGQTYNLRGSYMTQGGGGFFGFENFDAQQQYVSHTWMFGDGSDGGILTTTWPYYNINNTPVSELGRWRVYDHPYVIPAGIYYLRIITEDWSGGLPNDPLNHGVFFDNIELSTYATPQVSLSGSVTDDGLPAGSTLATTWSKVSGPGTVTFGDPNQPATTAAFDAAGVYTLRLTASDSALSSLDEMTVNVLPANQAPQVDAGADHTITTAENPLALSGVVTDDGLPAGATVTTSWGVIGSKGITTQAPLSDDFNDNSFDLLKWGSAQVDGSGALLERNQRLEFQPSASGGSGVSFRSNGYGDARGKTVLLKYGPRATGQQFRFSVRDDGAATTIFAIVSNTNIQFLSDSFFDGQTRSDATISIDGLSAIWLRWRQAGSQFFWDTSTDGINWTNRVTANLFRPGTPNQLVRFRFDSPGGLPAMSVDDFASNVGTFSGSSGPGTVSFSDPNQAVTAATFSAPGLYTLRLEGSDSELANYDDIVVTVNPANLAPVVSAGLNQTVAFPAAVNMEALVYDDGNPAGSVLTQTWSKVSGSGDVTFGTPNAPATSATFSQPGTYTLRLTASDSQLTGYDDVEVTVGAVTPTMPDAVGSDFWLMFPIGGSELTLFIAGESETTGTVAIPGIGFSQNFVVHPGVVAQVVLPQSAELQSVNSIEPKGIHVTTLADVTVYGLDHSPFSTDGYLGLPVDVLGTEYITLSYRNGGGLAGSLFSMMAVTDGTVVTITPAADTAVVFPGGTPVTLHAGTPYQITLNQGDAYQLVNLGATADLSGSFISADKPIAVFGGHACTRIPVEVVACDQLVEQLPSIDKWGTSFVTMPLAVRTAGDTFRVVASRNNTHVSVNGVEVAILNGGQIDERVLTAPSIITADQPIMVAQYANSFFFDSTNGDPFMMLVPPVDQFLSHYTVATPTPGSQANYINFINVVVPTVEVGSLLLDGSLVPVNSFVNIGTTGYAGAQLPVGVGSHTLSGGHPFAAFIYGFDAFDSYGYPAGMRLSPIAMAGTTTLTPRSGFGLPGTETCLTATVRDQNNSPLTNSQVNFSITGANSTTGAVPTNANGQAEFCYNGIHVGFDTIVATSSNGSDQATRFWQAANQPPMVSAGPDQHGVASVCIPHPTSLQGLVTDDGLPQGAAVTVTWSQLSGPPGASFTNGHAASTTVTFSEAGTYVFRLSASDTQLTGADDIEVVVDPAPVNQPPTVSAGPAQTISMGTNLIQNPSNEKPLVNGEIPDWSEVANLSWTQAAAGVNSLPQAVGGATYFYTQTNGPAPTSVLSQDVDISSLPSPGNFVFKGYLRAREGVPSASAQVTLELISKNKNFSFGQLDFDPVTTSSTWQLVEANVPIPAGAAWVRVRLLSTGPAGENGAGLFDALSLRFASNAATTRLLGTVTDDGLYCGFFQQHWEKVSGPGAAGFSDPAFAVTNVSFGSPGDYVLRLTGDDFYLTSSSDVTITVNAAATNQSPQVTAGADQTITLPVDSVSLSGTVTDDAFPEGINLTRSWSKVSGPAAGSVTFANASAASTTATFSAAGTYVLRLTGDDSELSTTDDVTIVVNPEATGVNQPPVVNPGPNQTISLPTDTVMLNGSATDDGLPVGSTLVVTWTQISGPGTVIFGNANSAVTTAQLSATGTYVLRLGATDGAYTISADVGVTLTPENFGPTANAGSDQTVLVSHGAQLDGGASDDGLPTNNLTTTWTKVSGPGDVTFLNPNVTITGAQFSAVGTYVLRLTASDGDLSTSDDITITVIDDVAPPTVEITAPADGSSVTEPTPVTGSVSSGDWVLEYSLDSDDNQNSRVWTSFATGTGPVSNGQLGTLDPTMMLNGLFDIRLSATDVYGQTSRTWIAVVVERNLKVGNFTVSFSDLNIPVAGVPMEVTRTYDSRDKRVGDFGFGWTLGLKNIRVEKARVIGFKWFETRSNEVIPSYCLVSTGSHLVTVTFPGGKVFKFEASVSSHCQAERIGGGNVTFTPLPGTHGTLEIVGPTAFEVEGSVPGPVNLVGIEGSVDIFNASKFKYTAEDGTSFVIDQGAGLQTIQDTNNNTVTVSAGGIIHSNGKSITFNRDALGRITSVTDPNANVQTYTYDAAGDLVSYTDNENNTSTYTYDANHRLLTIHDPRGIQPIRNDYDADGRLISHTDGFGKVIAYTHDLPARTETITDRLGHPTVFEYDERGNVLRKTDARGGVTSFTYDDNDNVLTETNALGKITTYTYDANDHRTSITDPLGNLTQFTYNGLGKVLTLTDPLGHVTTNTYNGAGNLLTTKDALDNTTTFTYSPFDGQRIMMTDALNSSTHYDYTAGYLSKETDALGNETRFFYDASGNRVNQLVKRTNAQGQIENIATDYEYDKLNRLTKTTFADGSFTRVEYNSIGQQAATIDQLGARTEFIYDDMVRMTKTTYPDGTHEDTAYDDEGPRLTSSDRAGHLTSFTHDELGRLTKTTFADGKFTSTSYDAAGQVLTTTDARGNVTHYFYDNAGRRTKVRNALNQETTFAYDAAGSQLSMTDALGQTTSYEYDLNNRRVKTIYADSTFDTIAYDAVGRSVSKTDQAGKTTQFVYDLLGRLTKVKDPINQETTYGYNELGQQVSQTDANNHTTRFEYDQLGRRVKRILPAGQFETYAYNNGGNLQSRTDFNGKTTTFNYDVMRRLLSKVPDASLNQPTVSFTYNSLGQRATMNDASGATVYTYDARNRLASRQTPFGTLSYTYNESGSLLTTRSSNTNGVSVDYDYDALNRLGSVKDNNLLGLNGGVTDYTYDAVGNLQSYSYPNGVTSNYAYNSLNRLTTMTVGTQISSLASYSYTLGAAGNRTAVTELSGKTVNYTYDDLYRLTNEAIANDPHGVNGTVSYGYDLVGNRLNRTSSLAPVPSQSSTYDANDRLTSDNYDNNGNTTSANSNTYAYDFENHLTSLNGGSAGYVYDGDGNRVAKTIAGITTNYLVDTNNPTGYAQVVDELQSGSVVKSYTYGHDLISQRIVGSSLSFYGYDGHGSVRLLTDSTAAVTDTYDYDAFGNLTSHTGTTPNDYLYSGEQLDANLGFYYLRARYMNPGTGRFLNMDSFLGSQYDPQSLHKYLYANGDPANRIDPSGEMSIAATVAVVAVIAVLAAISVLLYYRYFHTSPTTVVWTWNVKDWDIAIKSKTYRLSTDEISEVKATALETMRRAYRGYAVTINEGGGGDHGIQVIDQSLCDCCGQTPIMNTNSAVYYGSITSHVDQYSDDRDRHAMVVAIGRGIGNTAAHEMLHQYTSDNFHNTSDSMSYDFWSCDREEEFYGGDLHWTQNGRGYLDSSISRSN
jgi:RHS repeat-associated protein